MTDRFKFRAWDKVNKDYFEWFCLNQEGKFFGWVPKKRFVCGIWEININRFIIEQSTGLRDKNGVLIYDNDILRRTKEIDGNWVDEISNIFRVCWEGSCRGWVLQPNDKILTHSPYSMYLNNNEYFEIIGNIHEHSYLMEQET